MRKTIRFVQNGQIREIDNVDPNQTVLNFLRYEDAQTGTKEGCAEGDCGACTVVLGELKDDQVAYQSVNACIQFLPMLDGKELITVENLRSEDGHLHPVQQAMVDANATQCGFCTPGFVMSLFAEMQGQNRSDLQSINDVLAGNLCRCTGYGTIIEAAQSTARQEPSPHVKARNLITAELLAELNEDGPLAVEADGNTFFAPTTAAELAQLLKDHPDATLLAGATDVGLWVTKMHKTLDTIIYVGKVEDLKSVTQNDGFLRIGAAVSYSEAWEALGTMWPDLGELIRRIASTQIRNSGTIGGNIANGSPIGDTPPALIALGATLNLQSSNGTRSISLEDFFIEYGKQDLQVGEFVASVDVPEPKADQQFKNYKLSKRFDQDISALCGAFSLELEENKVQDIRICFGGMAGTPARAIKAEAALRGQQWNDANIQAAMQQMKDDYKPMSDMRASSEYRMIAAQNLLRKFYIETTSPQTSTRLVGTGRLANA